MMDGLFLALASVTATLLLVGLVRAARAVGRVDRLMAVQVSGTLCVALLLLVGAAFHLAVAAKLALVLALLGAITSVVFSARK